MPGELELPAIVQRFRADVSGLLGAEKAFDVFGKNVGGSLATISGNLTKFVSLPLLGIGAAAVKAGETVEKAYIKIERQTGATGKAADGLKKVFDNVFKSVPESADAVTDTVVTLHQRLQNLNDVQLEGVSKKFLELKELTGEALDPDQVAKFVNSFNIAPDQIGKKMNEMATIFQKTGTSVATQLQMATTLKPNATAVGFNVDQILEIVGKTQQAGLNPAMLNTVFARINANATKNGVKASDLLNNVIDAIQKGGVAADGSMLDKVQGAKQKGASDATADVAKLLGAKGFSQFSSAVKSGALNVSDGLGLSAEDLEQTVDRTRTISQQLQILKNQATIALKPLGLDIIEAANNIMKQLVPAVQKLMGWFDNLSPGVKNVLGDLGKIGVIAGPALFGIAKIASGVMGTINNLKSAAGIGGAANALGVGGAGGAGGAGAAGTASAIERAIGGGGGGGALGNLASGATLVQTAQNTKLNEIEEKKARGEKLTPGEAALLASGGAGVNPDKASQAEENAARKEALKPKAAGATAAKVESALAMGQLGLPFGGYGPEQQRLNLTSATRLPAELQPRRSYIHRVTDKIGGGTNATRGFFAGLPAKIDALPESGIPRSVSGAATAPFRAAGRSASNVGGRIMGGLSAAQMFAMSVPGRIDRLPESGIPTRVTGAVTAPFRAAGSAIIHAGEGPAGPPKASMGSRVMGAIPFIGGGGAKEAASGAEAMTKTAVGAEKAAKGMGALGKTKGAIGGIIMGLTGLPAPVALGAAAIAGLAFGLHKLYDSKSGAGKAFHDWWDKSWKKASEILKEFGAWAKKTWNEDVEPALKKFWAAAAPILDQIWHIFKDFLIVYIKILSEEFKIAWAIISEVIKIAWTIMEPIFKVIYTIIKDYLIFSFDLLRDVVRIAWPVISDAIKIAWDVMKPIFEAIQKHVGGPLTEIWHSLSETIGKVWDGISEKIGGVLKTIAGWIGGFMGSVGNLMVKVGLKDSGNDLKSWGESLQSFGAEKKASGGRINRSGGVTNKPTYLVGEGGYHPEYVIPTDPMYRGNATALYHQLGSELGMGRGVRAFAGGGIMNDIKSGAGTAWHYTGGEAVRGAQVAGGAIVDATGNVVDYVVGKARSILESLWPKADQSAGDLTSLPAAGINTLRDAVFGAVGAKDDDNSKAAMAAAAPAGQILDWIHQAETVAGWPDSFSNGLYNLIMHESGGNPSAQNNWDSNAKAGHPSKGLMQTIDSTFNAYKFPGHDDIFNPVDNILAGTSYALKNYGQDMVIGGGRRDGSGNYIGYKMGGVIRQGMNALANGGIVTQDTIHRLGESGHEAVIPLGSRAGAKALGMDHKTLAAAFKEAIAEMPQGPLVGQITGADERSAMHIAKEVAWHVKGRR